MSPKRTSLRFTHTIDIYSKTTTENDVGQFFASWTVNQTGQICYFTPSGSAASIRVTPTIEEADYYTIILPHDADIDYGSRIYNVRARGSQELLYDGPFQIWQIDKHVSYSGKVQFLQVKVKTVIE